MRFISLGSGSKGNATVIDNQQGLILLDCGFSRRTMLHKLSAVGALANDIVAILITHEHTDHIKGAQTLAEKLSVPIYSSFGTARKMQWLSHPLWQCLQPEQSIELAGMQIKPYLVPHDAQEPFQYVFTAEGKKLGVLSDLGYVTPHLIKAFRNCHGLQIEANYDPDMLKNGPYPISLQKRVSGKYGHLSNQQCMQFIQNSYWPGLQQLSLGHISEHNNSSQIIQELLVANLPDSNLQTHILSQAHACDWQTLTATCTT